MATPIVFWRSSRFSCSQETAGSQRLLTIIFVFVFVVVDNTIVYDIVKVNSNGVRLESLRPSPLMSSSSSYYVIAINDIRMMLGTFTRPLIAAPVSRGGNGNISLVSLSFNYEKEPHQKLHEPITKVVGL